MKKKCIFWSVLVLLIVSVLVLALWGVRGYLCSSPDFKLKTIKISSQGTEFKRLDRNKILKACGYQETGSVSIFELDLSLIKARLESSPWIETAQVRRILPGGLLFNIKEREGVARIRIKNRFFLIDSKAVVLPDIKYALSYDYPLIEVKNIRSQEPLPGEKLDFPVVKNPLLLLTGLKANGFIQKYPVLTLTPHGNQGIFLILAGTRIEVRLPGPEPGSLINILEQLLLKLDDEIHTVKYIDLRFKEPVIGKK